MKSFSDVGEFQDELMNFTVAQQMPSVVQWFSHYYEMQPSSRTDHPSDYKYNLVLELGLLNLNQLIHATKSPVLPRDVIEVWVSLRSVIEALRELHTSIPHTEVEGLTIQG